MEVFVGSGRSPLATLALFKGGRVRDDLAKPTSGVPRSWHDLKGGAHELRREAALPSYQPSPAEAAFRAAREAGRAIPLSWEIKDFPTHGEPQAVRAGVGPWTFPLPPVSYRKRHLAVLSLKSPISGQTSSISPVFKQTPGPHASEGQSASLSHFGKSEIFQNERNCAARVGGRRWLVPLTGLGGLSEAVPRRFLGERRPYFAPLLVGALLWRRLGQGLGGVGLACRLGRFAA